MYFLEKLCRICVQSGCGLVDINTVDFDSVKLSEKLEICANLTISKDEVSSEICEKCVNKLRVSYHFLDMCQKSTKIIQGYLNKLANNTEEEHNKEFKNYDLSVSLEELPDLKKDELLLVYEEAITDPKETSDNNNVSIETNINYKRKQRITKEQRCSLLKQLLSKPKKERDKSFFNHKTYDYKKGGLKNIIDFTRNYEFSFSLDKNCNIESTPLDKLTAFSTDYFSRDFSEFKSHVLYVIENRDQFEIYEETDSEEENKFEDIEPDVKIKCEVMDNEEDTQQCPLDYLETSFEEEDSIKVKKENIEEESENVQIKQERPSTPEAISISNVVYNKLATVSINSSPAVKLLDRLVSSYPISARKVFSPTNVRCRTRDQPYINPLLKNQFLYRSFRCERCNRYFKSQGYLKAHNSKVH